jgi:hypothetical protein
VLDAGRDAVFTYDSKVEDGWLVLGDQPGNGITFDPVALERSRASAFSRALGGGGAGRRYLAGVREGPVEIVRDSERQVDVDRDGARSEPAHRQASVEAEAGLP